MRCANTVSDEIRARSSPVNDPLYPEIECILEVPPSTPGAPLALQVPSPALSPTDPVPRCLLTLCPWASSGPQGLYTAYIQPIYSLYTAYIQPIWSLEREGARCGSLWSSEMPLPCLCHASAMPLPCLCAVGPRVCGSLGCGGRCGLYWMRRACVLDAEALAPEAARSSHASRTAPHVHGRARMLFLTSPVSVCVMMMMMMIPSSAAAAAS